MTKTKKTKPKVVVSRKTTRPKTKGSAIAAVGKVEALAVPPATDVVTEEPFKKADLIAQVTEATGLKRRDVKAVVEASLAAMAQALADGRDLNAMPLGKLRQIKTKELASGAVVHTLKLRRKALSDDGA